MGLEDTNLNGNAHIYTATHKYNTYIQQHANATQWQRTRALALTNVSTAVGALTSKRVWRRPLPLMTP